MLIKIAVMTQSIVNDDVMICFSGRPLDKDGKETNWWSKAALLEFDKKLKCYEKQYSAYKILGKWPVRINRRIQTKVALYNNV